MKEKIESILSVLSNYELLKSKDTSMLGMEITRREFEEKFKEYEIAHNDKKTSQEYNNAMRKMIEMTKELDKVNKDFTEKQDEYIKLILEHLTILTRLNVELDAYKVLIYNKYFREIDDNKD